MKKILLLIAAASGFCHAADSTPMHQGLHQWPAFGGKLLLVVGTYQDTVAFRRSYTFYFKAAMDETWYQTPVFNKKASLSLNGIALPVARRRWQMAS